MSSIKDHKDLKAWQKAVDLTLEVYRVTETFPQSERFGLISQIRRASVSIAANLAEGHGRLYRAEFLRFVSNARGSLTETETLAVIAHRLGYLKDEDWQSIHSLVRECGRIFNGLITALRRADVGHVREDEESYSTEEDSYPEIRQEWLDDEILTPDP